MLGFTLPEDAADQYRRDYIADCIASMADRFRAGEYVPVDGDYLSAERHSDGTSTRSLRITFTS